MTHDEPGRPRDAGLLDVRTQLVPNQAEVAAKVIDGEAIIMNLATGLYFSMDNVGAHIWEDIEANRCIADIVSGVTKRYEVTRERAETDVERIVSELLAANLVQVAGETQPGAGAERSDSEVRLAYAAPVLNRYEDMADLLLLDPPMPGLGDSTWGSTDKPQ